MRSSVPTVFASGDTDGATPLWYMEHAAQGFSHRDLPAGAATTIQDALGESGEQIGYRPRLHIGCTSMRRILAALRFLGERC